MSRLPLHMDLETSDPDDVMTVAVLATHPRVDLRSVTIFPGGRDQVGLIRKVLGRLGREDVLIGVGTPKKEGASYTGGFYGSFYSKWFGEIAPADPDGTAVEILRRFQGHLVTGAPLTNILKASQAGALNITGWTCQGGFVGDNLMPNPLPKFAGRQTCPTWNFGGDRVAAEALLAQYPARLVPKSVCHGVFYTQEAHARIPAGAHPGLDLLLEGMTVYFQKHPDGKALHDLLAGVLAIDPTIGTWIPVRPYREKGEWGCAPGVDDRVQALIHLDVSRFEKALAG